MNLDQLDKQTWREKAKSKSETAEVNTKVDRQRGIQGLDKERMNEREVKSQREMKQGKADKG